ncbi:unnamed protein product [Meganyctiphanes norvegica]|uniref:Uncharacterized protein n=1 Tax=Meganyctiphanes norvegica TaxID=48144 RepID=A0AAV2R001_MEGNR
MAIGYATYFLKSSLIQDRLIVSLTSLLVLLTLFSQVGDTLPKTSYVKMIDDWFLFTIVLLLFIILSHMFIDISNERILIISKGDNKTSKYIPTAAQVHKILRYILVPGVFVVFSLIFWLIMVYQP